MAFGFLAQLPHCSANSLQLPAHAKISLLGRKKFPAPMGREFRRNWSGLLLNPTAPAAKKGENCEIPCRIPCSQGIWRQESNGACCADSVRPETALDTNLNMTATDIANAQSVLQVPIHAILPP